MIQLSEIDLGYSTNNASKERLMCLLNLAREMRRDRETVPQYEVVSNERVLVGTVNAVEDIRYVSLLKELAILVSQIPQDLTPRVRHIAVKYLMHLYRDDDITIITK